MDGRIAVIAFMGGTRAELDVTPLLRKRATITGSTLRPCSREHKAQIARELRQQVWPLLAEGRCMPTIESSFALDDAEQAHRLMESASHFGKIVLRCAGSNASWAEERQ